MKTCPICNKQTIIKVNDIINDIEGYNFVIKGERCTSCGEELIDEEEGQRMIHIAKKIGIWGQPLRLHRKLSRSARGTVLRIPTDIEKNLHLKGDEDVLISKVGPNKILVEVEDT
ncbi:YgiT-type zinc finger protein [Candidatus Woesearchaeota archaeon]|nr:YgiT-type zinc finger protein [Candidatus Woesearchaeota archaeon]